MMYGQRSEIGSRQATVGEHVIGGEGQRPRKVAPWPWWKDPKAWTPWTWDETLDQFQSNRKTRSQI